MGDPIGDTEETSGHDLGEATALDRADDLRFTGRLDPRWEIWGPMGGYVASLALRAAGEVSPHCRPASFACHYLGVAAFGEVEVEVEVLRRGRTASSQRISIRQGDRRILEAVAWGADELDPSGIEHHDASPTGDELPAELPTWRDLGEDEPPPYAFWHNFDQRPLDWHDEWPPAGPEEPRWRSWLRFRPGATFDDPWLDACRVLILLDVASWPSAHIHHAWREPAAMAPTIDLYAAFHAPASTSPWLLVEGHSPSAATGLAGFTSQVFTEDHRLVGSGAGQMLVRPLPPSPT